MFIGMVLYKDKVFCSDIKFKMAAMAELSLTLDLMGKHLFTETTWTIETKLFRNVHLMGLYNFFYADWKSKLATISSHKCMWDPVGNQSLEGPLQTLWFFLLIGIPR
jgi:hypothetical protein